VFMLQQPRRQGWHDLAASSVVIKERVLAPASANRAQARTESPRTPTSAASAAEQQPVAETMPPPPGRSLADSPASASAMTTADSVRMRPRRSTQGPDHAPVGSRPTSLASVDDVEASSDGRPLDVGWVAVLDDGREVEVLGLVLLGRNPQARPGEEDAELIKVADETRTVSKTHLSLRVDASGLFVMDRGSTNGTTLTDSTGASRPCPAGDVMSVRADSIVSFGDHWLKVEHRG
jgi:hypothetical protein